MIKDFNFSLMDSDNKEWIENGKTITALQVVRKALENTPPNVVPSTADSIKRFFIIKKIRKEEGKPDLTADDIVFIKECIGPVFSPLVTGQMVDFLDS